MKSGMFAIAGATLVLILSAGANANTMKLSGFSSDDKLPLSAQVHFDVQSPNDLIITVTNTASSAGPDNRITFFGMQLPEEKIKVDIVESKTDGSWKIDFKGKLPGAGANRFHLLTKVTSPAHHNGLQLGEQLTLSFHSDADVFEPLTLDDWQRTNKSNYLLAAKFQSVGGDGEDSGVATRFTPQTVPEPASLGLLVLGGLLVCSRSRRVRETTT